MRLLFLLLFVMASTIISANVTLPSILADNMVLQRNSEVAIWGWADPNEPIVLTTGWNGKSYQTKANNHAFWQLKIQTDKEGGPYRVSIKGYNEITLQNVMLGEVWLCSGQSNMEMSASWGIENGESEINNANYPNIRFFTVPKLTATSPQNDLPGNWKACTPETMQYFSAVAYFFGKRLQEDLKNVPIGLIASSWGGTPAEIWIPEEVVTNDNILSEKAEKLADNQWGPYKPGRAFNAMIHPLVAFNIAGVLWYQGESNVGSDAYEVTLSALIHSWRKLWNADFPFYFVQIAPYNYGENHFGGAIIRNAQRKVLQQVPNTGMVVTSDISPINDIHPQNKKSVGVRLANLALKDVYKTNNAVANGPLFKSITIVKNKAIIYFDDAEGLYLKDQKNTLFEVAGADGIFYPANTTIKNNSITVFTVKVSNPVKVRYAWKNNDLANLFNKYGLPASTFISQ